MPGASTRSRHVETLIGRALLAPSMVDAMHLAARSLHVGAAMLWVGYLGVLAWVLLPAARGEGGHPPNLGPILKRVRPFRWLGPATFLFGFWLVTATGRSMSALVEPGWGHAILGGIALAVVMMGLEHGLVLPRMRKAHRGPTEERTEHVGTAQTAASAATVLGLAAAVLMVLALLGGV